MKKSLGPVVREAGEFVEIVWIYVAGLNIQPPTRTSATLNPGYLCYSSLWHARILSSAQGRIAAGQGAASFGEASAIAHRLHSVTSGVLPSYPGAFVRESLSPGTQKCLSSHLQLPSRTSLLQPSGPMRKSLGLNIFKSLQPPTRTSAPGWRPSGPLSAQPTTLNPGLLCYSILRHARTLSSAQGLQGAASSGEASAGATAAVQGASSSSAVAAVQDEAAATVGDAVVGGATAAVQGAATVAGPMERQDASLAPLVPLKLVYNKDKERLFLFNGRYLDKYNPWSGDCEKVVSKFEEMLTTFHEECDHKYCKTHNCAGYWSGPKNGGTYAYDPDMVVKVPLHDCQVSAIERLGYISMIELGLNYESQIDPRLAEEEKKTVRVVRNNRVRTGLILLSAPRKAVECDAISWDLDYEGAEWKSPLNVDWRLFASKRPEDLLEALHLGVKKCVLVHYQGKKFGLFMLPDQLQKVVDISSHRPWFQHPAKQIFEQFQLEELQVENEDALCEVEKTGGTFEVFVQPPQQPGFQGHTELDSNVSSSMAQDRNMHGRNQADCSVQVKLQIQLHMSTLGAVSIGLAPSFP